MEQHKNSRSWIMRRSQLWKEHAHELSDWEKGLGSESQSEHNTARYFGCEDDRRYTANLPRHSRNFTEKVFILYVWVSKRIVEAVKKRRNSQELQRTLYPKWISISPFVLCFHPYHAVNRWVDSAHLSQSRSDSHGCRVGTAERSANPHSTQ